MKNLVKKLNLTENIIFQGERNDVYALLNQSAIFVLASLREGLPLSIIEAMAYGKAIIASKVGGVPELIKDDSTGFLFNPGDSEQLSNKIMMLLSNKHKCEDIGKKS